MPRKQDNQNEKKEEKRTTLTLNLSSENKKALKMYAVENDTTISALINEWIEEKCKK